MFRYKSILWITFILLGWILLNHQRETHTQPAIPTHEELKNHTWTLVTDPANERSGRFIMRELKFTGKNQFEVIETFKFSGSTFRNPGRYSMSDSVIRLKSFDGQVHIANLRPEKEGRLRIEWLRPRLIHGHGSEIYQTQENEEKPKQIIFSSRVFEFFKAGS
jgi:hypothetical protein